MKIKVGEVVFGVVVVVLITASMNLAIRDYTYWEACTAAGGMVVKVPGKVCVKDAEKLERIYMEQ